MQNVGVVVVGFVLKWFGFLGQCVCGLCLTMIGGIDQCLFDVVALFVNVQGVQNSLVKLVSKVVLDVRVVWGWEDAGWVG